MAKQFAIRLSLIAFSVSLIESLMNGDDFGTGLVNGGTMAVFAFGIGIAVGEIARRIIEENAALEFGLTETTSQNSAEKPPAI